ncbi:hypothetical protein HG530_007685 [Fusarium avenaceum]|nr:hypothetical protein HG530_007685 [Fusarium avenaceum]
MLDSWGRVGSPLVNGGNRLSGNRLSAGSFSDTDLNRLNRGGINLGSLDIGVLLWERVEGWSVNAWSVSGMWVDGEGLIDCGFGNRLDSNLNLSRRIDGHIAQGVGDERIRNVLRVVGAGGLASPKAVEESGMVFLTCLVDCESFEEGRFENLAARSAVTHIILSDNTGSTSDLADAAKIDPTGGDLTCDEATGTKVANAFALRFVADDTVLSYHVEFTAGERKDGRIVGGALRDGDVLAAHVGERTRLNVKGMS